jgi:nitroreductase
MSYNYSLMTESGSVFNDRYVAHQAKKRDQLAASPGESDWRVYTPEESTILFDMLESRRSQRTFNNSPVTPVEMDKLAEAMAAAPSSCNRQAITGKVISERPDKEILSGLLIGGVGWVNRADKIVLLFADEKAYPNSFEKRFMPYLDAGAMVMTMSMAAEAMGVGSAYINPGIREQNQPFFADRFGGENLVFTGAMALGHYDTRVKANPRRGPQQVWSK